MNSAKIDNETTILRSGRFKMNSYQRRYGETSESPTPYTGEPLPSAIFSQFPFPISAFQFSAFRIPLCPLVLIHSILLFSCGCNRACSAHAALSLGHR
jgi:hypothetical protein